MPKIESAEMMFSASRSRRLQIVPIIQSFAQLERNYGKEGSEIIIDNTQLTIFGGFAPNSSSADILSKSLGNRTAMSGSVSKSKNEPSQSLQMTERQLMTPDELKTMPKGTFIVMKTGFYPMKVKLKLFFEWGITFEEKFEVIENSNRKVENILMDCGHFEQPLSSTEPQPETVEKAETDIKENSNVSDRSPVPKEHEGRTKLRKSTDK